MEGKNTLCSWSGGKDSCFALMKAIEDGYRPKTLLNVLNEAGKISRSHGIPSAVLEQQAALAGIPLTMIASAWQDYEKNFIAALHVLKSRYDLTHAVFGDIDLQAHRDWEEKVCSQAGLEAVLPLWKGDRFELVKQMLEQGIETMIISCNETMGERFLGRILSHDLANELVAMGIDPCGEHGEFHTLVLNCPLFSGPLQINAREKINHDQYWFLSVESSALKS